MKATKQAKFHKAQLLKSDLIRNKDVAMAVLRDDRLYTADEAVKAITDFIERKVK